MSRARVIWIICGMLALVLAALSAMAWAQPRLLETDLERLAIARSVGYQPPVLVDYDSARPRHYFIDMSNIAKGVRKGVYADPPLDARGVPVVDYATNPVAGANEPRAYNPITTAQYGLALYGEYLNGEDRSLDAFFIQADWLVENMASDGGIYYEFDLPGRDLFAPWLSGMAQGQAISVLVRAYYESDDERYLEAARLAFEPLSRTFDEGGVMYIDDSGGVWLEEYPEEPPSHVLNGMIFSLFGLYDLMQATGDERVARLFEDVSETLADNLHRYEQDGWIRYQLTVEEAWARGYYRLHISQLLALAALTGDMRFQEAAEKWERPIVAERRWLLERTVVRMLEALGPGNGGR
ncbi:MAG: hypothetical protein KGZ40_09215 [Clostridiales bacterium]|nr:hypothetical protein [Clostridiales bacterium]